MPLDSMLLLAFSAPPLIDSSRNVAVVGNSGARGTASRMRSCRGWPPAAQVGKSLLINKMRRIRPGVPDWAPTGVRETTLRWQLGISLFGWAVGWALWLFEAEVLRPTPSRSSRRSACRELRAEQRAWIWPRDPQSLTGGIFQVPGPPAFRRTGGRRPGGPESGRVGGPGQLHPRHGPSLLRLCLEPRHNRNIAKTPCCYSFVPGLSRRDASPL